MKRGSKYLLPELRREAVDLHLGVLVVAEQADHTFNDLAYRRHRFAFPYADAESVIACRGMDRQGDGCRKPGVECFGLSLLEALGVMDPMDDRHEHGVLRPGGSVAARRHIAPDRGRTHGWSSPCHDTNHPLAFRP